MCLTNRSEIYLFGQERMMLREELARITGHVESVGLYPGGFAPGSGGRITGSNGLGNCMVLPCVGSVLLGIAMEVPRVLRPLDKTLMRK